MGGFGDGNDYRDASLIPPGSYHPKAVLGPDCASSALRTAYVMARHRANLLITQHYEYDQELFGNSISYLLVASSTWVDLATTFCWLSDGWDTISAYVGFAFRMEAPQIAQFRIAVTDGTHTDTGAAAAVPWRSQATGGNSVGSSVWGVPGPYDDNYPGLAEANPEDLWVALSTVPNNQIVQITVQGYAVDDRSSPNVMPIRPDIVQAWGEIRTPLPYTP
jgi:hypothetical protein